MIGELKESTKNRTISEFTDVTISVKESLKGESGNAEMVLKVESSSISQFIEGEENLLFIYKDENDEYHLVNGNLGQFKEIEKDVFQKQDGKEYSLEEIKSYIIGEN